MVKNYGKIILASLLLVSSVLLEIKQKSAFGWGFDLAMVAVLILPLFLDFPEFLFFISLAFLFLYPIYPWSAVEAALLIGLPVLSFVFQKVFPWQSWLESFVLVLLGLSLFYGVSSSYFFGSSRFLILDLSVSMVFGWALYCLMSAFAGRRA